MSVPASSGGGLRAVRALGSPSVPNPLHRAGQPRTGVPLGTMPLDAAIMLRTPMNLLQDKDATCPHCWETITLTLDLSVPEQSYVEDCPVCCKPMLVSYTASDGEVAEFSVESAE